MYRLLQVFFLVSLYLSNSSSGKTQRIEDYKEELSGLDLGSKFGLNSDSVISAENLRKITVGAEHGNKDNLYFLGLLKLYGISVNMNPSEASQHILQAAELGLPDAMTAYGVMRYLGIGVELDYAASIMWFKKGVVAGDMNAHWFLGKMMLEGIGFNAPLEKEAATYLQVAAEKNSPQALNLLALMYEYGRGVHQHFGIALDYYKQAVELNHVESMYNLGLMHMEGRGTPRDYKAAASMFQAAAQAEHAPATYMMGIMRMQGYGRDEIQPNYEQALNWFQRAAVLGDERITKVAMDAAKEVDAFLNEGVYRHFLFDVWILETVLLDSFFFSYQRTPPNMFFLII